MGCLKFFLISLTIIFCMDGNEVSAKKSLPSIEARDKLIDDLFKYYDRRNYPSNVTLKMGLTLLRFDVNSQEGLLETDAWLNLNWVDPRLTWNPSDYANENKLRLPASEIWKPDFELYNNGDFGIRDNCKETPVVIHANGSIHYIPPCNFRSHCDQILNASTEGEKQCDLKFGSWVHDGNSMDLILHENPDIDLSSLTTNGKWKVMRTKGERNEKFYACCKEPYVDIVFSLVFKGIDEADNSAISANSSKWILVFSVIASFFSTYKF